MEVSELSTVITAVVLVAGLGGGAFLVGQNMGYDSGYDAGVADGNRTGYDEGYDAGVADGNRTGYDEGYDAGFEAGNESGWDDGYTAGVRDGRQEGYDRGYADGNRSGWAEGYEAGQRAGYDEGYSDGYTCGSLDWIFAVSDGLHDEGRLNETEFNNTLAFFDRVRYNVERDQNGEIDLDRLRSERRHRACGEDPHVLNDLDAYLRIINGTYFD